MQFSVEGWGYPCGGDVFSSDAYDDGEVISNETENEICLVLLVRAYDVMMTLRCCMCFLTLILTCVSVMMMRTL